MAIGETYTKEPPGVFTEVQPPGSTFGRDALIYPDHNSAPTPTKDSAMYAKSNLTKLKKLDALTPEAMKAFWAFDKAALADGVIPVKYKELIAVAVALTTQCPYCIDIDSANARKAGATEAEIAEAALVAAALRAGGAITHATHALLD